VDPTAGLDSYGKYRPPPGIRSPDLPARSESLYRQSYRGPFLGYDTVQFLIRSPMFHSNLRAPRVTDSAVRFFPLEDGDSIIQQTAGCHTLASRDLKIHPQR
jgi:hypothetical protein